MDDLHAVTLEYGIILKDLAVIDRQFKGEVTSTMDKLTKRALKAHVEAANVDRKSSNKVKQEEGALRRPHQSPSPLRTFPLLPLPLNPQAKFFFPFPPLT
ncbi:hypothetical protein EDB86DRAFT_2984563, partial [Lactarius hatsudake]